MKKIFVCSPYRGDIEANTKVARYAAKCVFRCGRIPIVPHLYFPQFLDENNQYERITGIRMGAELLKDCDGVWVFGNKVTEGMAYELGIARELKLPVELYDSNYDRIFADTLQIDDRVDDDYREAVKGLNLNAGWV